MNHEELRAVQIAPPNRIPLLGHEFVRPRFDFGAFDPDSVRVPSDLPPYLLLGPLDAAACVLGGDGWTAVIACMNRATATGSAESSSYQNTGVDAGGLIRVGQLPARLPLCNNTCVAECA